MKTTDHALTPADIADAISGSARHCAKDLRAQGWEGGGESFDLGVYHGCQEDLETLLSRKATKEERIDLERAIKAELDASSQTDTFADLLALPTLAEMTPEQRAAYDAERAEHVMAIERIDVELARLGGPALPPKTPAAIVAVLEERGAPMQPRDVHAVLTERGRQVNEAAVQQGLCRLARAGKIERKSAGYQARKVV